MNMQAKGGDMISNCDIWEMDLRATSYHEAGHLIVLQELGGAGHFYLTQHLNGRTKKERFFSGTTAAFTLPNTPDDFRAFCLAGEIAVALENDPDVSADEIHDYLETGVIELSETDAQHGVTIEALELAHEILRKKWPDVQRAAEFEISLWENPFINKEKTL